MSSAFEASSTPIALPERMTAMRIHAFGGPEVIREDAVGVPTVGDDQVLVKVLAAGVGPWDGWIRAGRSVLPQPLPLTLGSDIAGVVVAAGPGVQALRPGDAVYGVTNRRFTGGYAEYAACAEATLSAKPRALSFIEAASAPVAAVTAWQMLFQHGRLGVDQRVLVHGARGSVGRYAVQMARRAGLLVIASGEPALHDELLALGAHQAVELGQPSGPGVDAVLDLVGGGSQAGLFAWLRPAGRLVSAVSAPDPALAERHHVHAGFMLVDVHAEALSAITALFEAGALSPWVGPVLPLHEALRAHAMLEGRAPRPRGKIVLDV